MTTVAEAHGLTATQLDALGLELERLRAEIAAQLGAEDVAYIRRVIRIQRWAEVGGRASLFLGFLPPFWLAGVAASRCRRFSTTWRSGTTSSTASTTGRTTPPCRQRSSSGTRRPGQGVAALPQLPPPHLYQHHRQGPGPRYGVIRISGDAPWTPANLGTLSTPSGCPDLRSGHHVARRRLRSRARGQEDLAEAKLSLTNGLRKSGTLAFRDYVMWPAFTGPLFLSTLAADALANVIRNVWSFIIIFCGHFHRACSSSPKKSARASPRATGTSARCSGRATSPAAPLPHHVRKPELPDWSTTCPRHPGPPYQQIAPRCAEICRRYGVPYNTGRLSKQFGSVIAKSAVRAAGTPQPAVAGHPGPPMRVDRAHAA